MKHKEEITLEKRDKKEPPAGFKQKDLEFKGRYALKSQSLNTNRTALAVINIFKNKMWKTNIKKQAQKFGSNQNKYYLSGVK